MPKTRRISSGRMSANSTAAAPRSRSWKRRCIVVERRGRAGRVDPPAIRLLRERVRDGLEGVLDLTAEGRDDPDDHRSDKPDEHAVLDRGGTPLVAGAQPGPGGLEHVVHRNSSPHW